MPENPEFGSVQCLVFSQISNKQVWDILRGLIRFKHQFGWMNKLCMGSNEFKFQPVQFEAVRGSLSYWVQSNTSSDVEPPLGSCFP